MILLEILVIRERVSHIHIEEFREHSLSDWPIGHLLLKLLDKDSSWSDEYEVKAVFSTKENSLHGVFSQLSIHHPEFSDEPVLVINKSDDLSLRGVQIAIVKHVRAELASLRTSIKVLEKQKAKLVVIGEKLIADCNIKQVELSQK